MSPVNTSKDLEIKINIEKYLKEWYEIKYNRDNFPFIPGHSHIPISSKVFDEEELIMLMESCLDFRLTSGKFTAQFEAALARFLKVRHVLAVNSGSSANLLAVTALTSPTLGNKRLKPGDEVITLAASFPTTINPIIQNNLIPVFVDISVPDYNIDTSQLNKALSPRTKAIFSAHTMGNPFDISKISEFAGRNNLWLIEDCCDALGSKYSDKHVGTYSDIATLSFYPAHHITTGEGGAVITNNSMLKKIITSYRDWGRDCWCNSGHDNSCKRRFETQMGDLPCGYDHKYVFSHIGYNLKITEMQAAIGIAQIRKLSYFIEKRKNNFELLYKALEPSRDSLILPEKTPNSDPSWFGFLITIKENAGFSRRELINRLEENKIATRPLFAGNIIKQPAYKQVKCKQVGELKNTDFVMNNAFWIGVHPGITEEMISYMTDKINKFVEGKRSG